MQNRLRQRDLIDQRTIAGQVVRMTDNRVIATYSNSANAEGYSQYVYDFFEKKPFRKSNNDVPEMREVQMSKLELLPPKARDVSYKKVVYPYSYSLKGFNLGMAPISNGMLGDLRPPTTLSFISTDAKVNSYLLQRAYSRMSSAEFDFGITVGEVAETAAFLAKPLSLIASMSMAAFQGCRAVFKHGPLTAVQIASNATSRDVRRLIATTRKHPIDTSLRLVDESANHWLAYKFGVLPIIDDVGKALDFKENNVARLTGLRIARVKGPKLDTTSAQLLTGLSFGYMRYDTFAVKRTEDRHYCGLYFRDKCQAPLLNFMESLGFAPWQLPSLAYELIPLSFVVDRFIDIKSFVRGNIGSLTKETYGSYHSRKITTAYSYDVHNVRWDTLDASGRMTISHPLKGAATMYQLARTINADRPTFPVINPYWRTQLVADATNLSLIWGRLRTHVGKFL